MSKIGSAGITLIIVQLMVIGTLFALLVVGQQREAGDATNEYCFPFSQFEKKTGENQWVTWDNKTLLCVEGKLTTEAIRSWMGRDASYE